MRPTLAWALLGCQATRGRHCIQYIPDHGASSDGIRQHGSDARACPPLHAPGRAAGSALRSQRRPGMLLPGREPACPRTARCPQPAAGGLPCAGMPNPVGNLLAGALEFPCRKHRDAAYFLLCSLQSTPLVGSEAPDFTAEAVFDQEFVTLSLSQYRVRAPRALC